MKLNRLYETFSIDNNIFGFEKIPKINLVEIPNELLFYNGSGSTKEANKLPNNTFFDANHTLYQNRALNKTYKYYHIDYQFLVKEPEYDKYYKTDYAHEIIYDDSSYDFRNNYHRKTYYGRTNRVFFKLCHDFCGACVEFGLKLNNQKCLNCLENYTFDYWYYLKKYIPNCIPEGYYYDNTTDELVKCETITYKYFDVSRN